MNHPSTLARPVALTVGLVWCAVASAAVDPVITKPPDGAVVSSPFEVEIDYGDIAYCDTDGCSDVPAEHVSLYAEPGPDATLVASCTTKTDCPDGKASFEVSLPRGQHVLQVNTDDGNFSSASSKLITITVQSSEDDGCGCSTTPAPGHALPWLAAAALLFRRRGRPARRAT